MVTARPETMTAARKVARLPSMEARCPLSEGLVQAQFSLKATHAIVDVALTDPEQARRLTAEQIAERQVAAVRHGTGARRSATA